VIIPKEELANFQRWQAGSFDKKPATSPAPAPVVAEAAVRAAAPVAEAAPPTSQLPTAEEIESIHETARAQGYEAGLAEGKAAGEHLAVEAAEANAQRFNALLENLKLSLKGLDQTVADQLLALAIEIAAQLTRGSISAKTDILLPIIREAITTLPMHHAHVVLRLNPVDAENVRTLLGDEFAQTGTQIVEDHEVSLGGCLLEAGSSEVDASIETRWKRVLEAIGTEPQAWLTP
jgi:flagellar assembly protein FliH